MGNNASATAESKSLREHVKRTTNNEPGRNALILGATGATGKFILSYLICSDEWNKVTIIHRREVNLDEISKQCNTTFTKEQQSKVTQNVIDMEKLCENEDTINKNVELFKDHDIILCALGTRRSIAGTADKYRQIDYDMVRDSAILAKKAGIKHYSLVSTKGANANIWANDWKITHGLLYLKTKGEAEQAVIKEKFNKTSIFRSGVLARDGNVNMFKGLDVRDLAAVIVYDAESDESKDAQDAVFYYAGDIDTALVVSRNNFNEVCVAIKNEEEVKEAVKEEEEKKEEVDKVVEDDTEDVNKKKEEDKKEDNKDDVNKKEEDKKEDDKDDVNKKEDTKDAEKEKYEVVEKPEDGDKEKDVEPKSEEVVKDDDYVEVRKDDAEKDKNDGNQ